MLCFVFAVSLYFLNNNVLFLSDLTDAKSGVQGLIEQNKT